MVRLDLGLHGFRAIYNQTGTAEDVLLGLEKP